MARTLFYVPRNAPPIAEGDAAAVMAWAAKEFDAISQSLLEFNILKLAVLYAAPDRPRNGMIVYADGTSWNPGFGQGPYAYLGGSWTKLFP